MAGAVAVSTDTGTTAAFATDSTIDAGSGDVIILATPKDVVSVFADGEFASSAATGVGVAVTVDVAERSNLAYIGGTIEITAASLTVGVGKIDAGVLKAPDQSTFTAQSIAGVGNSSDVGVAGSLAINVIITDNRAYIDEDATLTLHGNPDVTVGAYSDVSHTTKAVPADGGGIAANVGVGASVALTDAEDTTAAYVGDNATVTGAHNLGLTADSVHATTTQAKNGAKGGTAITPVVGDLDCG